MLYSGMGALPSLSMLHFRSPPLWADCQVDDGQHFAGNFCSTDPEALCGTPSGRVEEPITPLARISTINSSRTAKALSTLSAHWNCPRPAPAWAKPARLGTVLLCASRQNAGTKQVLTSAADKIEPGETRKAL